MPQTDASKQKILELENLQAELIANEKANTYSPVVPPEAKQYFSGNDGGNQGNNQNAGGAQLGSGMSTGQHAAFRMARGGIISLI
jgi:hypothetical protein